MTFVEQVTATLIGTSGGFLGSLALFWIRMKWEKKRETAALMKNLNYELDYNINLFTTYEETLTKAIEAVGADSHEIYL
ncbi:MAG: hypothetical protein GY861_23245, partial [bacterium]|nr:hypothetical protein [bacterium]